MNGKKGIDKVALIFDMDGTLIKSTEADYLAWKRVFEDHNKTLRFEDYEPLLGVKSAVVVKDHLHLTGNAFNQAMQSKLKYFEEIVEEKGIDVFEKVYDFLIEIKSEKIKTALATSSRKPKTMMLLKTLNLFDYFDIVVTGDMVNNSKPEPDIYLFTAKKLEVEPENCIVFEDAVNGVEAARRAGMKSVAITNTHQKSQLLHADMVISSFSEITLSDLFSRLLNKQ